MPVCDNPGISDSADACSFILCNMSQPSALSVDEKIGWKRSKHRKCLQENLIKLKGFYFDGRKDKPLSIRKENGKSCIEEEHFFPLEIKVC